MTQVAPFSIRNLVPFSNRVTTVERIHIVGHSRGTDVVASAIRELHIENQAEGHVTHEAMKLQTIILAAPDLLKT